MTERRNRVRASLPSKALRERRRATPKPKQRPAAAPIIICFPMRRGRERSDPVMRAMAAAVSMKAMGSFDPDSISKRESVWYLRERRLPRRMEKTDAASVEEMTAPIRKLSATPRSRMKWASAASPKAERTTPTVDKRTDALRTGRAALRLVPKPP